MADHRSPEAHQWRRLYKTGRWLRLSAAHLAREPLCVRCLEQGRVVDCSRGSGGGVVDHIVPHKGDPNLFFDPANFETLCHAHHSGDKQAIERGTYRGYSTAVGDDGMPIDPKHPWNRG